MKHDYRFMSIENSGVPKLTTQSDKATVGTITDLYNPGRIIDA